MSTSDRCGSVTKGIDVQFRINKTNNWKRSFQELDMEDIEQISASGSTITGFSELLSSHH